LEEVGEGLLFWEKFSVFEGDGVAKKYKKMVELIKFIDNHLQDKVIKNNSFINIYFNKK